MAATKPTLVLVHGGWHVPESYEKLITALEKAGYEVHCPRLPTTNQVRTGAPSSGFVLNRLCPSPAD
jgi:alpha-beta hydrolase superfamily lysophospholipase